MKKLILLVLIAMSLIVVGCSDDSDSDGGNMIDDNFAPLAMLNCDVRSVDPGLDSRLDALYDSYATALCPGDAAGIAALNAYLAALASNGFVTGISLEFTPSYLLAIPDFDAGALNVRGDTVYLFMPSNGRIDGNYEVFWAIGEADTDDIRLDPNPSSISTGISEQEVFKEAF